MSRPKIAMYWASSCGGCDISLLEIGAHIVELAGVADIAFWPCAADFKYKDVEGYADGSIDICLFNGGVRNSEQEQVARLLRRKSRTLVAYGACAREGGIPALANFCGADAILDTVYGGNPPQCEWKTPAGTLELPHLYPAVLRLRDVVAVDYELPGCPPQAGRVLEVVQSLLSSPPLDSLVGCTGRAVCDECPREKRLIRIRQFRRHHEFRPEPGWCLLEQGVLCMGPATRSGCGALCLKAGMPCEGCYGASGDSDDQGAAMIGALGSLLDAATEERAAELVSQIPDPAGSFYRFAMSSSILRLARNGAGDS